MDITYYDIGLNLFTRSFPNPEKIISDAEADGICCILTGSEGRAGDLFWQLTHNQHRQIGVADYARGVRTQQMS